MSRYFTIVLPDGTAQRCPRSPTLADMTAPMPAPTRYKGERATVGEPIQRYRDWINEQQIAKERADNE